ncbi:hypothetical protein MMC25_001594 [Agyrium rufum]|nr:hypothetical protein [Agyrium rufum]
MTRFSKKRKRVAEQDHDRKESSAQSKATQDDGTEGPPLRRSKRTKGYNQSPNPEYPVTVTPSQPPEATATPTNSENDAGSEGLATLKSTLGILAPNKTLEDPRTSSKELKFDVHNQQSSGIARDRRREKWKRKRKRKRRSSDESRTGTASEDPTIPSPSLVHGVRNNQSSLISLTGSYESMIAPPPTASFSTIIAGIGNEKETCIDIVSPTDSKTKDDYTPLSPERQLKAECAASAQVGEISRSISGREEAVPAGDHENTQTKTSREMSHEKNGNMENPTLQTRSEIVKRPRRVSKRTKLSSDYFPNGKKIRRGKDTSVEELDGDDDKGRHVKRIPTNKKHRKSKTSSEVLDTGKEEIESSRLEPQANSVSIDRNQGTEFHKSSQPEGPRIKPTVNGRTRKKPRKVGKYNEKNTDIGHQSLTLDKVQARYANISAGESTHSTQEDGERNKEAAREDLTACQSVEQATPDEQPNTELFEIQSPALPDESALPASGEGSDQHDSKWSGEKSIRRKAVSNIYTKLVDGSIHEKPLTRSPGDNPTLAGQHPDISGSSLVYLETALPDISPLSSPLSSLASTPSFCPSDLEIDIPPITLAIHANTVETTPTKRRKPSAARSPYFPKGPSMPKPKISCIPFPPLNATTFGLAQERLAATPFHLLLAVMFLNKTRGTVSMPVFYTLIHKYPTPVALAEASHSDIVNIIQHLGLQNRRAEMCISLAQAWLANPPERGKRYRRLHYPNPGDGAGITAKENPIGLEDEDPRVAWEIAHLPGSGAYALDSWRIFCRDSLLGKADAGPIELDKMTDEDIRTELDGEWAKVRPWDKELRAYLRWRWLRLGWEWDPVKGKGERVKEGEWNIARGGGVVLERAGAEGEGLVIKGITDGGDRKFVGDLVEDTSPLAK